MRSRTLNSLKRGASSISSIRKDSTQKGSNNEMADEVYFSSNNTLLTSEPESLMDPSEDAQTPTVDNRDTTDRMATVTNSGLRSAPGALNAATRSNSNSIITEAPKPTPPPSLQRRATAYSMTSPTTKRAQRHGTTGSSASESDSNLDLDERIASRMGSMGSISSSGSGTGFGPGALMSQLTLQTSGVSPEERKRRELQMRVWKARLMMPVHVNLRVFKDPKECEQETDEILQREMEG
ncbi:hypothetical protein NMY22_g7791 [Coprinellus aureogranulatus]|nr:hypothetical protein NMY22_g7791 [Coprinellus aureogranulatus]